MATVTVQDGAGNGFTLLVDANGRAQTEVNEVQQIVEPVTTRPEIMSVATSTPMAGTTSSEVVAQRTGRRWLEIQNLGDKNVHIRLAASGSAATANHRRLLPGEVYRWRDGVAYEGAVQAIAIGGSSQLTVQEFYTS